MCRLRADPCSSLALQPRSPLHDPVCRLERAPSLPGGDRRRWSENCPVVEGPVQWPRRQRSGNIPKVRRRTSAEHGTLKSERSGRKVKSKKQAIAIGLSEARKKGAKVP